MTEYIRICVDDDVDAARRAYTKAPLGTPWLHLERSSRPLRAASTRR